MDHRTGIETRERIPRCECGSLWKTGRPRHQQTISFDYYETVAEEEGVQEIPKGQDRG